MILDFGRKPPGETSRGNLSGNLLGNLKPPWKPPGKPQTSLETSWETYLGMGTPCCKHYMVYQRKHLYFILLWRVEICKLALV